MPSCRPGDVVGEPLAKSVAEIHAIDGADHVFDGAATGQMCRAVTEWMARKVAP